MTTTRTYHYFSAEKSREFHRLKKQVIKQRARATPKPKTADDVKEEARQKLEKLKHDTAFQKSLEKDRIGEALRFKVCLIFSPHT